MHASETNVKQQYNYASFSKKKKQLTCMQNIYLVKRHVKLSALKK